MEARILNNSEEFFKIVEEIDGSKEGNIQNVASISIIDRLKKTQLALNQEAQKAVLERFGIKNVSLDNLEQVYNPLNSGFSNLQ